MSLITLNQEKCIKCGICVKECPTSVLTLGDNGPKEIAVNNCIGCGHCVAVCPKEAIDNVRSPLIAQVDATYIKKLNSEDAEHFLRQRRSIRNFKDTAVSRENLKKLVDVAHLAPTASNSQGISFVIVDDREVIDEAVKTTIKWFDNHPILRDRLSVFINSYNEQGFDTLLREAPAIVLATSPKDFSHGRENSILSLAYLELFAPALDLGSCWAGVFEICALSENSPLLELFNIEEGKKITGAVMVGYPKYSYKRLVNRKPLEVSFFGDDN